ncbi:hypothetical protein F2Q70_00009101 [Brassica cretica]|uniref:Uncharacterized protein n=1 Tax=Brassica cretica TaxID=69181 RepID=A0A8S9MGK8_BRACR|nr:hypothetical protein F2Q70_00009101 [Brassica cretica]
MRAVGEIPSSNNLRLQNLHRRVDENAWTNCRIDVSEELGCYVATELWLELDRYVATERSDRASARARSLCSDRTACMCGSSVMTELGSSVFRSSYSDLSVTCLGAMLRNEEDPTDGEARSAVEPAAARLDPMQIQAIISEIKRQLRLEIEAVEVRVRVFSSSFR